MKVLLDAGAAVDRRDHRNGWTALQHAIHTRDIDASACCSSAAPIRMLRTIPAR